jgi:hypothetical protein
MGVQTLVVFIAVALPLALVITIVSLGLSLRVAGLMILAVLPVVWAVMHVIERRIGRGIWQYSAPVTIPPP